MLVQFLHWHIAITSGGRYAAVVAHLCVLVGIGIGFAKPTKQEIWSVKENLSLRLTAEWHKITILSRESSALVDILDEIRDLELYPSTLTGFSDKQLVTFDKDIEQLDKHISRITKEVNAYKAPLTDAIAIFREMVVGEPVESMFAVLERGDFKRINNMLSTKHAIDTLWKKTDQLLITTMQHLGMPDDQVHETGDAEDEFFTILKANLGQQSTPYYGKLKNMKLFLLAKAEKEEQSQIFHIEYNRINKFVSGGNYKLARRTILNALAIFSNDTSVVPLQLLLARVQLLESSYQGVLETTQSIDATGAPSQLRFLYRIQSFYALQDYPAVLKEATSFDISSLQGEKRNLVIWILMESNLALKKQPLPIQMVTLIVNNSTYSLHAMHAVARYYLSVKDDTTALAIFEKALLFKPTSAIDRMANNEIKIARAQLYFNRGNIEKANKLFYQLLSSNAFFERALFGIIWCYLSLNQYDKAETALRKLINQAPQSALGAEAILLLSRRYLQSATFEWKKMLYLDKEKSRLSAMLTRINSVKHLNLSEENQKKYSYARKELTRIIDRIEQEPTATYTTITARYDNLEKLCSFIETHYGTGSFQMISFSLKRKKLLQTIDSVTMEITTDKNNSDKNMLLSNARIERVKIHNVVEQSIQFSVNGAIDRYRFERSYIEWEKGELKKAQQHLAMLGRDSVQVPFNIADSSDKITSRLDSLLIAEDTLQARSFTSLRKRITRMLSGNCSPSDVAYFTYQRGELYYTKENVSYTQAYEQYEKSYAAFTKKLAAFRNGTLLALPAEPIAPRLNHDSSMHNYRAAIAADATSPFCAAAHYSLAWCFNDIVQLDSAHSHMQIVARSYPDCPHAAQAWMYSGEYAFDHGNLTDAITCFQDVMKYPESEWFDEALYKLAWTQYRLSNPEKAISSFLALVDLGGNAKIGASLLEKESMDYIAISFSETDMTGERGLSRAIAFAKKLGDPARGCQILHRLANVYREQGRYDIAIKTYAVILSTFPNYDQNPFVEAELLAVAEREISSGASNDKKYDYFKKYNRKSAWSLVQKERNTQQLADSTAAKMLYDASIGFHQQALQGNDTTLYSAALRTYTDFITYYPISPLANECHYNLAEIHFSLGNYRDAAEDYIAVSKRYPDSKYKETAAWNAIVASQNLLKREAIRQ